MLASISFVFFQLLVYCQMIQMRWISYSNTLTWKDQQNWGKHDIISFFTNCTYLTLTIWIEHLRIAQSYRFVMTAVTDIDKKNSNLTRIRHFIHLRPLSYVVTCTDLLRLQLSITNNLREHFYAHKKLSKMIY